MSIRSMAHVAVAILCTTLFVDRVLAVEDAKPRKIVLIAGPITGHPKDTHEYEKNVILLKHLLDTSSSLKGKVVVEVHFKGWPADEKTLDDADTILITSDGGDHRLDNHPFYVGNRMDVLARQMKRGCGLVQFHWSTFNPVKAHDQITEWLGGYFDYETGAAANKWRSAITTRGDWTVEPHATHAITRGVRPFKLKEEFYHHIRFRDDDQRLSAITTVGKGGKHEWTVGWAVERANGGRGFGFTGGHFYENWWNDDFRRLILNAVAWSAKVVIPEGGVESTIAKRWKALIVTGHNHPAHDWRAVTAALIGVIELDPFAIVHVTENPEDLAGDKLNDYELVVLNYCNWDRGGLSDKAKASFEKYVQDGGGLAVIHFANGAFNATLPAKDSDWPRFRQMVRRVWMHGEGRSGHDAYGGFKVNITPVKHAITARLASFETTDELYFKQEGEQPVEALATARSKVTGNDEPLAWAHDQGSGRVFQTLLGHDAKGIRAAGALIRRGAGWAAKRENISFDPPVGVTENLMFRAGSQWRPVAAVTAKPQALTDGSAKPQAAGVLPPTKVETVDKDVNPSLQRENDWVDDRWSKTDLGRFFSCSMKTPGGDVARAVVVRVGEKGEASICYDTTDCVMKAAWTGGFVKLNPARYGLIRWPEIDGKVQLVGPKVLASKGFTEHLFLWHHGHRVILGHWHKGAGVVLESPWVEEVDGVTAFTRAFEVQSASREIEIDLADGKAHVALMGNAKVTLKRDDHRVVAVVPKTATHLRFKAVIAPAGTDERKFAAAAKAVKFDEADPFEDDILAEPWPQVLTTKGVVAADKGPYVVDTITVPFDNPYKALFFISGVDFLDATTAAVCTVHGDVWIVSGIDAKLEKLTWRRFATGLYQPMGLKVIDGEIHVLCRDRIVKVTGVEGAEYKNATSYKTIADLPTMSAGGHDYAACLESDADGNLYYIDPKGAHRFIKPKDSWGKWKHETLASGFRNPIAMSVSPDGDVTVSPQEGEWTPSSMICLIRQGESGKYFGYGGSRVTAQRPLGYDLPLCYVPHHVDNATGGQVWVTSDKWGPLKGQLLNLSFGMSTAQLVLRDMPRLGPPQGAVVPLKFRALSGIMRGRFSPQDGQLYVTGMRGWQTNAVHDGCFQRVRYTGKKVLTPTAWRVEQGSIILSFSEMLDRDTALDTGNYAVEQWNYLYSAKYGSKEYSANHPNVEGHDGLKVTNIELMRGMNRVRIVIPDLKPVMQIKLSYNLESATGDTMRGELFGTIHTLGDVTKE